MVSGVRSELFSLPCSVLSRWHLRSGLCSNEVSQSARILDKCDHSHHHHPATSFPPRHLQRAGQVRQHGLSSPPPPDRGTATDWTPDTSYLPALLKIIDRKKMRTQSFRGVANRRFKVYRDHWPPACKRVLDLTSLIGSRGLWFWNNINLTANRYLSQLY